MSESQFKVANMNCDGCVTNIRNALEEADIQEYDIQLNKKLLSVTSDRDNEQIINILAEAGYQAKLQSGDKGFLARLFNS